MRSAEEIIAVVSTHAGVPPELQRSVAMFAYRSQAKPLLSIKAVSEAFGEAPDQVTKHLDDLDMVAMIDPNGVFNTVADCLWEGHPYYRG